MKKISIITIILLASVFFAYKTFAQTQPTVNYDGAVIVDSDLDGLTDKGEQDIYGTDPKNPDTDGDGIMDGTESIKGTDPLDISDPAVAVSALDRETPWAWYVVRAAGLIGFVFLWLTIFLGLAIRNPLLKKIIEPIYSFDFHCFMAAAAVFWALVHGSALLFDRNIGFGPNDILIPYFSKTTIVDVNYLALGIMAFYMMIVMTVTSYLRRHMSHWLWRALHFLNPLAFLFVVAHGYNNGTDTKNFYVGSAFLFSSFLLILIYLSSLVAVVWNKFRAPSAENILNK